MELVMGVGPMNLVITNDALYQLSYTSAASIIVANCFLKSKLFFAFWKNIFTMHCNKPDIHREITACVR